MVSKAWHEMGRFLHGVKYTDELVITCVQLPAILVRCRQHSFLPY